MLTAVCSKGDEIVIGGMGAIITDRTSLRKKHASNPFMAIGLMKEPNITTVFALDESMFVPIAERKRRATKITAADERGAAYKEEARLERIVRIEKFRALIKLGTRTNCGMVIDMRGPLVEVQLPTNIQFGGDRTFWISKTDLTNDPPPTNCSFGQ